MDEPSRTSSSTSSTTSAHRHPGAGTQLMAEAGPKACATCRLAHVCCDRAQPCGRCVRVGKAESCQPPPTRKRGRPRKAPPPDDQPHQPQQHEQAHQHDDDQAATAAASKRVCVRPKTTDPAVVGGDVDSQPPHATPAPSAGTHCCSYFSSSSTFSSSSSASSSSSSPSSLSPAVAEEEWAWPPPAPLEPAAGSLSGHRRSAQPATARTLAGQEQDSQEGLRSLLGLVVDQMREMRRENERLHDTIAQLRATQNETGSRLARVEQDNEIKSRQLNQVECRLARVEVDHQARLLEQTRSDLNNHAMTHQLYYIRDHVRASSAFRSPAPLFSASQATAAVAPPRLGLELQLVAAAGPTTPRAEVEQFIAQTLPWLQEFDCSSLILRDLQRPFFVVRMKEAETLDDLGTPVIAYMSPSMCELLEYDMFELHGSLVTSICSPRPEYLVSFVRLILMRPPTRVGKPFSLSREPMITKHGRKVHLSTTHQFLYNQRRLAQWHIIQVSRVLETDLGAPSLMQHIPNMMQDSAVRAHLLARLPHSLLFGCQGEMATTPLHDSGLNRHRHEARQHLAPEPSQHSRISTEELTVEEAAALTAAMKQHHQLQRPPQAQGPDGANDAEDNDCGLDELVRVLGLPIESGARASPFSRLATGFNWSRPPPTTQATLAERWMR